MFSLLIHQTGLEWERVSPVLQWWGEQSGGRSLHHGRGRHPLPPPDEPRHSIISGGPGRYGEHPQPLVLLPGSGHGGWVINIDNKRKYWQDLGTNPFDLDLPPKTSQSYSLLFLCNPFSAKPVLLINLNYRKILNIFQFVSNYLPKIYWLKGSYLLGFFIFSLFCLDSLQVKLGELLPRVLDGSTGTVMLKDPPKVHVNQAHDLCSRLAAVMESIHNTTVVTVQ